MRFPTRFLTLIAVLLALSSPLKAGDLVTYTSSGGLISGIWGSDSTSFSNLSWLITGTADTSTMYTQSATSHTIQVVNPTISLLSGTDIIKSGYLLGTTGTTAGNWFVTSSGTSISSSGFVWYPAVFGGGAIQIYPFFTQTTGSSLNTNLSTNFTGTGTSEAYSTAGVLLNTSFGGFKITSTDLGASTFTVAVPEPSSLALFGLGALALLRRRRS